jgi:hypothetical protein
MAKSATERDAEAWIRDSYLPKKYKMSFAKKKAPLTPGGRHEFDAVSEDDSVAACISTLSYAAAGPSAGAGRMHTIRSDAFFLLLAVAQTKLLVFTESDMYDAWLKEQTSGRVPAEIRLVKAELPGAIRRRLDASQ